MNSVTPTPQKSTAISVEADTWPECLRDSNNFNERLRNYTYDPGCSSLGPFGFYSRWLTNFGAFSNIWWPWTGLYALVMGLLLVVFKYTLLNPPFLGSFQTKRRYDFQLPMSFCMSELSLTGSQGTNIVQVGGQKPVSRGANHHEFWQWFSEYFLNIWSKVPGRVRTWRFSIFTMTPGKGPQIWYEQVNLPLLASMGIHFPLPPVSGTVHVRPSNETCSLTIRFYRWSTHWAVGSVVATPHPDPDIPFSIWFRASFQIWPFLGWAYDIVMTQCIKYYIDECLRQCVETGTLEGEHVVKFTKLEDGRVISRIVPKGSTILNAKPVWR
jgi:hypothetical protein